MVNKGYIMKTIEQLEKDADEINEKIESLYFKQDQLQAELDEAVKRAGEILDNLKGNTTQKQGTSD